MTKEKPLSLFDEEDKPSGDSFKINQKFAQKYQHNKARVEQERLEAKYGKDPIENEDSYDSETEDDNAVLLTSKAEDKYNQLLRRI